jgi:ferritin
MQAMDEKLYEAMNAQVTKELFSAYLYLSMAAYFEQKALGGMAGWMKVQAKEEVEHGMKFFNYINDRGDAVKLGAFEKPKSDFKSIKEVFQQSLKHEQGVTASINKIYDIALKVNDHAVVAFLQWFVDEQVEEEKNVNDILAKLEYVKEDSAAILMLDRALGERKED